MDDDQIAVPVIIRSIACIPESETDCQLDLRSIIALDMIEFTSVVVFAV